MLYSVLFILFTMFLGGCASPDPDNTATASLEEFSLSQSFVNADSSSILLGQSTKVCLILRDSNAKPVLKSALNVEFINNGTGELNFAAVIYDEKTGFYCTTANAITKGEAVVAAKVNGEYVKTNFVLLLNEVLQKPSIYPKTSYYDDFTTLNIKITHSNQNAKIYYTTDGTEPTKSTGTLYNGAFEITTPKTIKAIAYVDDANYAPSELIESELSEDISVSVTEDIVHWNKSFNAGGIEEFKNMAIDSDGNLYVVGYGHRLLSSTSDEDWWIKKFDKDGIEDTTNWNKKINGTGDNNDYAYGIAIDSDDNVYVVGTTHNGSNYDWWIKKFDKNGVEDTTNWNKQIDGNGGDDYAYDVVIDKDDNIYVVGFGYNLVGSTNRDVWIKKFDKDGVEDTTNWDKKFNFRNSYDYAFRAKIDRKNKLYVIGSAYYAYAYNTRYDWWIKKYTLDGQEDTTYWDKKINFGAYDDYIQDIAFDSNNNVYVVGIAYAVNISNGYSSIIKKYTEDGEEDTTNWNKLINLKNYAGNISDTRINTIAIDSNDNVYVAGAVYNSVSSGSNWDWFLLKYDRNGIEDASNFRLTINIAGQDYLRRIMLDDEQNIFVIGGIAGTNYDAMIKKIIVEK